MEIQHMTPQCIAFAADRRLRTGTVLEVALATREHLGRRPTDPVLVFDAVTSRPVDLNVSGSAEDVAMRYAVAEQRAKAALEAPSQPADPPPGSSKPRRGRPKLGVVGREVTLLPRHWEWLEKQPGSASVTLRKLVDRARKSQAGDEERRAAQESTYRFMLAIAGDRAGYEEALRALYAGRADDFRALAQEWPPDVRDHALELAAPAFGSVAP